MIRAVIAIAAVLLLMEFPVPWNFVWIVVLLGVASEWTPHPLRVDAKRAALWVIDRHKHDDRVRRARAKAGLTSPFGDSFECPGCGGLADIGSAMAERDKSVVGFLNAPLGRWDQVEEAALSSPQPVRAATLQGIGGLSFDDATLVLSLASQALILAPVGDGFRPCRLYCATCYRRAVDTYHADQASEKAELARQQTDELARQEAEIAQAVARASRPGRDPIPARLRFEVLNRDGFRCRYCGRSQRDGAVLHVDHVVPFSN